MEEITNKQIFFKELETLCELYDVKSLGSCGCCKGTGVDFENQSYSMLDYSKENGLTYEL